MTKPIPISRGARSAQQAPHSLPAPSAKHALSAAEGFATRQHAQSPAKGLAGRPNAPRPPVDQSPA